ncbi:YciI family protein [Paucidesulfovibrio longus]|uniref:YciI family protein n=1 Tax=Paucidesulfovibrio longus TaxID=889 RepID=UPI0003B4D0BB|nr:YciI family protein [Paucidesulfovibrio longus]
MFIVSLTYLKPLEVIDSLLEEHVAWLKANYADGVLLASGRKVPRTGGILLARAESREALDAVLAGDPFHREGAARYEVIEFAASMAAPGLEALINA